MANPFLQTHYRRSATDLTPEQIEVIRHLKNKVPTYMIVRDYHIRKKRVHDTVYGTIVNGHNRYTRQFIRANRRISGKRKHRGLSLYIRVSDDSSEIVGGDLEAKKDTIDISPDPFSKSSPSQSLIILQDSGDVSEMFKKVNIEMKKVRTKGCTITSKLATGT
ncbi:unnamed protein product [Rhizophagus irregularis]|nr:unnamed protein product [Rhizophagus irregularis]